MTQVSHSQNHSWRVDSLSWTQKAVCFLTWMWVTIVMPGCCCCDSVGYFCGGKQGRTCVYDTKSVPCKVTRSEDGPFWHQADLSTTLLCFRFFFCRGFDLDQKPTPGGLGHDVAASGVFCAVFCCRGAGCNRVFLFCFGVCLSFSSGAGFLGMIALWRAFIPRMPQHHQQQKG